MTQEDKVLCKRLRAPAFWFCESNEGHPGDATALAHEAAVRIERLSAEKAELERAGDRLSVAAQTSGGTAGRDALLIKAISRWSEARTLLAKLED